VNPSTALASVLVDELLRIGVREAVLAPGSRSAPLALALHDADAAGRLRLHVRIDERSAGFLALGLAKASVSPVPVVTTSGTAAVNLHPAVVEASQAGVPLVVLTADRPAELHGSGANQTIDQVKLYGDAVRLFAEVGAAEERAGQNTYWRSLVGRALAAARGDLSGDPGPVHLNVAFREPLVPDGSPDWRESLDGRPDGNPWVSLTRGVAQSAVPYAGSGRTLVIVGDCPGPLAGAARHLAQQRGWPLVAEPLSGARGSSLQTGALLLSTPSFLDVHRPERVLVVGRPTLSRAVSALLRHPAVALDVVSASPRWSDPTGVAETVAPAALFTGPPLDRSGASWTISVGPEVAQGDRAFLDAWCAADERAGAAVAAFLADEPELTGLHVARTVLESVSAQLLVLGSSSPVRDVDLVGVWAMPGLRVVANRGAAGIDGTVSTAVGAALASQRGGGVPAYALMGDLTFLHDGNGLVLGPREPRPDLCIVVVNDDGGSIFGLLEQGAPEHAASFERVFGTPHGVDLASLCAATGTAHERVITVGELRAALGRPTQGIRVVEARTDRRVARDLHVRLRAAVTAALRHRRDQR
jgi:2-succinyl-5-enolpyruvyl-6-hydroxy-3-cyclohexene-1-carboxylate synthase